MSYSNDAQTISSNIEIHRKEAPDFKTIHPELYNKTEYSIIDRFIAILNQSTHKKTMHILDLACGTGRLTQKFIHSNFRVTGCDLSLDMLNQLRKSISSKKEENLTIFNGTFDDFITKNPNIQFDVISMGAFLHHIPRIKDFLSKIMPSVSKEGYIFILHDPELRKSKQRMVQLIIEKTDSILFQLWYLFFKGKLLPRSKEYGQADIHTTIGIDSDNICEYLKANGFTIIEKKKYFVHKTRVMTLIDSFIFKALPQFYIIAQRNLF